MQPLSYYTHSREVVETAAARRGEINRLTKKSAAEKIAAAAALVCYAQKANETCAELLLLRAFSYRRFLSRFIEALLRECIESLDRLSLVGLRQPSFGAADEIAKKRESRRGALYVSLPWSMQMFELHIIAGEDLLLIIVVVILLGFVCSGNIDFR